MMTNEHFNEEGHLQLYEEIEEAY